MEIEGLKGLEGTDMLQETFLFKYLNFDESVSLARLFKKERMSKGYLIIEEGALGRALYLVEQGKVCVFKGEDDSREDLAVLGRGEIFGEMSLIEDQLTSASVEAQTNAELLVITRKSLEKLMEDDKDLAQKIYKTFCHTLSERLRRTSEELFRLKAEKEGKSVPPAKQKKAKKTGARKKAGSKKKTR